MRYALASLGSLALIVACSGQAIVEPLPNGGPGGQSSSSSSSNGSGASTSTSTSGVGGSSAKSLCEQICDQLIGLGCVDQECFDGCLDTWGPCQPYFTEVMECLASTPLTSCELDACEAESHAFNSCVFQCSSGDCGWTSDGCWCLSGCGEIMTECVPAGDSWQCSCYLDSTLAGTCTTTEDLPLACHPQTGCCGMFYDL